MRDLPEDELRVQLARTRDELFRLHLGMHTNQVTSSAQLRTKRRDIARIMTILNGRTAGIETRQAKSTTEAPAAEEGATAKKTKKTKGSKS
ncbi:MAG: 50S ribosomal protein L29 [Deltaproteobacteria bacterium]|nr:50S ribosomal protein L29 [Deltaproteobacteria bacterium]